MTAQTDRLNREAVARQTANRERAVRRAIEANTKRIEKRIEEDHARLAGLEAIALDALGLDTLDPRGMDDLDFHTFSVSQIRFLLARIVAEDGSQ